MDGAENSFVADEVRRQCAHRSLELALQKFLVSNASEELPLPTLPALAELTFSDGGLFLSARDDGTILAQGPVEGVIRHNAPFGEASYLWHCLRSKDEIMWSHLTRNDLDRLGLLLEERSSIMVIPAQSFVRPRDRTGVLVYRAGSDAVLHSKDSYQVWDLEAFRRGVNFLFLAVEAVTTVAIRARLAGLNEGVVQLLAMIRPHLFALDNCGRRSKSVDSSLVVDEVGRISKAMDAAEDALAKLGMRGGVL